MAYFFNRILFSMFCWENLVDELAGIALKPLKYILPRIVYKLNLFGSIKKHYTSFEEFVNEKEHLYKDLTYNLDYGSSSYQSKGALVVSMMPYFMLLIATNKYLGILPMPYIPFNLWLIIAGVLSSFVVHYFCLKNDKYKTYFKKFKNNKNNTKWHFVCLLYIIGACVACYWAIILFNADYFGI